MAYKPYSNKQKRFLIESHRINVTKREYIRESVYLDFVDYAYVSQKKLTSTQILSQCSYKFLFHEIHLSTKLLLQKYIYFREIKIEMIPM